MASSSLDGQNNDKPFDFFNNADLHTKVSYRRLGTLNGFLLGLIISVSYWLLKVIELSRVPVENPYTGAIGSSLIIILLCTFSGWLTTRISKNWVTILVWLVTAVFVTVILGIVPILAQNWLVWVLDNRFAGLAIYNVPPPNIWWNFVLAGYVLIIALFVLALLQEYRLEKAHMELSDKGRLTRHAFLILFVPALLTAVATLLTPDFIGSAPRQALAYTHEGIQTGRGIEGELFEISLESGFNYSAINGVRDLLAGDYDLMVGEIDASGSTITTVANFDSGSWINCRVNADYLQATYFSFCAEAQKPYTIGFSSLLTGDPLPENCFGCLPNVDATWQSWLDERAELLGNNPQFSRVAQEGRFVLAEAKSANGDYAIECMFEGLQKVSLLKCGETIN